MLEKELVGTFFLRPVQKIACQNGFLDKEKYAAALKTAFEIGQHDEQGRFVKNREMMIRYASRIPAIADALCADTHDDQYRTYKLASLEKGLLRVVLEWWPASVLKTRELSLDGGRLLKSSTGLPVFLVDLQGPAYEVIAPDTVASFVAHFVDQPELSAPTNQTA